MSNLKRIVMAMHGYHQTYGSFPPATIRNSAGQPLYSWRVLLLPYLRGGKTLQGLPLARTVGQPTQQAIAAAHAKDL